MSMLSKVHLKITRRRMLILVFLGCILLWWHGTSGRLSDKQLDRIELGMSVEELVAILGQPASDNYSRMGPGVYPAKTMKNGQPYTEYRDVIYPLNGWNRSLIIDTPNMFPEEDWKQGNCHFWSDDLRIFWITLDDESRVKSKNVTTITKGKANFTVKRWVLEQLEGIALRLRNSF